MPDILAARSSPETAQQLKDKSVIFLFMGGGPSQIETFDPKMNAPAGNRSMTGEVKSSIPGITFGATFPKLASRAHKLTIVRSYATKNVDHDIKPLVGPDTLDTNIGSIYARVSGMNARNTGMLNNTLLYPRSVDPSSLPFDRADVDGQFAKYFQTGFAGREYAPFVPGAGGRLEQDMKLKIPIGQLDDRRRLLEQMDQVKSNLHDLKWTEAMDRIRAQAYSMILGSVGDAFDVSKENPHTLASYDTSALVRPETIDRKFTNHKKFMDHGKTLGKLLLLARRLCERGCGFVTVSTGFVWDMHDDKHNPGMVDGMRWMAPPFDHVVSAFIDDVEARGLADKILLVCSAEMGRTPRVQGTGGRNHWGGLSPLLLYGGGLPTGQVIGQSNQDGSNPKSQPVSIKNLLATILNTVIDVDGLRTSRDLPREMNEIITWRPIPGTLS